MMEICQEKQGEATESFWDTYTQEFNWRDSDKKVYGTAFEDGMLYACMVLSKSDGEGK